MTVQDKKQARRLRLKRKIRKRISGTAEKPRLTVYRSNSAIYAQLIDDIRGITLVSASSNIKEIAEMQGTKVDKSFQVGLKLAEKAKAAGIVKVVFDRNGYKYHGRVKAVAEGARKGDLAF